MKAVILAGGLGLRLRPFTEIIPKPLLPIGEKSLLEIQIERLRRCGFDEIFLATNYKSEYISNFFGDGSRYGVQLEVSMENKPLGTAGPISLLKDRLDEPFILLNGDILTSLDFRMFYDTALDSDADLCVAIKKFASVFDYGRIRSNEKYVLEIDEKPEFELEIMAGIYVIKTKLLERFPSDQYFGMDELIRSMLAAREKISKYEMDDIWLDIGQIRDYEEAQTVYREHFLAIPSPADRPK